MVQNVSLPRKPVVRGPRHSPHARLARHLDPDQHKASLVNVGLAALARGDMDTVERLTALMRVLGYRHV
jgi:hypothetical protein